METEAPFPVLPQAPYDPLQRVKVMIRLMLNSATVAVLIGDPSTYRTDRHIPYLGDVRTADSVHFPLVKTSIFLAPILPHIRSATKFLNKKGQGQQC